MTQYSVAIKRFNEKENSVKEALESINAFSDLKGDEKVFIKPNIVVWTNKTDFPKWGVITTSRVIEDIVKLLVEAGISDITIGEGIILLDPKNKEVPEHAFRSLGYEKLNEKYGVKFVNIFDRPFEKVEVDEGITLNVNSDILNSDLVINVPVMKTHAQTVVSLGMKNLKGVLNIASRKKCHSADPDTPLDFMISLLPAVMPPAITVIDGIYSLERGPAPDGKARKTDIIIASKDMLSADMAGAKVLGHEPSKVKYLSHAAEKQGRTTDLSDIKIIGESIESCASFHEYDFPYNDGDLLHKKMEKMGITGLTYRKYDNTMCTYCSVINGAVITSIFFAWKGESWGDIDILTGKKMLPIKGKNKTLLLGQCMYNLHKDNPDINELIAVKGCPPDPEETARALQKAGIPVELGIFQNIELGLGMFMQKYKDRPEFDDIYFTIT